MPYWSAGQALSETSGAGGFPVFGKDRMSAPVEEGHEATPGGPSCLLEVADNGRFPDSSDQRV